IRRTIGNGPVLVTQGDFDVIVNPTCDAGGYASAASESVCMGANTTIKWIGTSGTIQRWEFSTDGGNSWTTQSFTSSAQIQTASLNQTTLFRAVLQGGPQSSVAK